METFNLKSILNEEADIIATFCSTAQQPEGGFPSRSFYGLAYALALWQDYVDRSAFQSCANSALEWYTREHLTLTRNPETHWEFINYGLIRAGHLPSGKFHNNERVINWMLLRLCCQVLYGIAKLDEVAYMVRLLDSCQQKDGLIPDFVHPGSEKDPSHQYHNFSTCLLGELVTGSCRKYFEPHFRAGVAYIKRNIKDGDINYIGRGAKQVKGYAVGIHALVQAEEYDTAASALTYMMKHKRNDEPYPLMFGTNEPHWQAITPSNHGRWETYNNYFDYLPLAGYYLKRAAYYVK